MRDKHRTCLVITPLVNDNSKVLSMQDMLE